MKIRKSNTHDIQSIMRLIQQAQTYFKNAGIDQWQDGYPKEQNILTDIEKNSSYVLVNPDVIATMYFAVEDDPNYHIIKGQWLTAQQPYAVIHRIVIDESHKGQNLAKMLLDYVIENCQKNKVQSIRIDTHQDNLSMQRFLKKNGFELCGHITLESGAPRIAFEKLLNK